ncbi:hypothetical protein WM34_16630 [Burkholderia ubonensis]|uniref:hypothetical protein n=1 Tax=Burkholderia ubonensis TaxID=101571 RepID=UPI00075B5C1C|nr:hypothetical protein [Burkholderia ubonensis]KVO17602.1 hypothetical protein WJ74_08075 [Burkholderia ubonensis]KVO86467.1 hypothetical protein WJ80_09215 [Burkholderia ubonensis]KVQ09049.1 hypothetical protein WJ98_04070 [Burkholderia ubonensis]KVQ64072.1 hypothetical protein WK05_02835 [Burkholderia ubonensis]KWB92115.1 hypothetical protein WL44_12740 [Burkholderia ubonensis]
MSVIAPDERADFVAVLHRHHLAESDFTIQEAGAPEIVDEVYPLQGYVTVVCCSTHREKGYTVGHGTAWIAEFDRDLTRGAFG